MSVGQVQLVWSGRSELRMIAVDAGFARPARTMLIILAAQHRPANPLSRVIRSAYAKRQLADCLEMAKYSNSKPTFAVLVLGSSTLQQDLLVTSTL